MKTNVYEKAYTRDTSVIMQQVWSVAMDHHTEEVLKTQNPFKPSVIDYMKDGVNQIWENRATTAWIEELLLGKSKEDEDFFIKILDEYASDLEWFKKAWSVGHVDTLDDLITLVNKIFKTVLGFIVMYYSGVNESMPESIRDMALKLRDEDAFFDKNDELLRNSILKIYPQLTGCETTVLRSELTKLPDLEILKERKKNFVYFGESFAEITTIESFLQEHPEYHFKIEAPTDEDKNYLKGFIAYSEDAEGVVRVVKRKGQIKDLIEGEILVAPMTTPEYLPAMKKAAAIIADEGGITCHAAIVARELKIPCIIGTKFATEVLSDGMRVRFDAKKGIVETIA